MATLQILSDLHLESPQAYDNFQVIPVAPHLALLGDIGYTEHPGLYDFLHIQLRQFQTVFFLLGNHEPYEASWDTAKRQLQNFQATSNSHRSEGQGLFVFLDQTRFDLSDSVTILGCTLYSKVLPHEYDHVRLGLNDFYRINDWTVEDHNAMHESDLAWLDSQVAEIAAAESTSRHVVILTHHSPTRHPRSVRAIHAGSKLSSGFMTDLSQHTCWTSSAVKVWAFGHSHYNCDFIDERTNKRIVTNQRGYYFAQAEDFDARKVLDLTLQ